MKEDVGKELVRSRVGMKGLLDGLQESAFKEIPSYHTSFPSPSLPPSRVMSKTSHLLASSLIAPDICGLTC